MNQEQLRHHYLDALGISSWLPCAQLPGAPASPEWVNDFQYPAPEIPFESDRTVSARAALNQSSQPLKTPPSPEAAQVGMSQARAALGLSSPVNEAAPIAEDKTDKPSVAPTSIVAERDKLVESQPHEDHPSSSVADSVEEEQPRFKLAFQRIGAVLVLDSMPLQGNAFGEHYQALSQAIVRSLEQSVESVSEPFMLPWPMFASKTLDQSRKQAVIAVQHKLNKELAAAEVKAVIFFGEASAQMALDRLEELSELSGTLFSVSGGAKAIATSSLTEAMQLPGVKRQIWQDLQPLLTYLNQAG